MYFLSNLSGKADIFKSCKLLINQNNFFSHILKFKRSIGAQKSCDIFCAKGCFRRNFLKKRFYMDDLCPLFLLCITQAVFMHSIESVWDSHCVTVLVNLSTLSQAFSSEHRDFICTVYCLVQPISRLKSAKIWIQSELLTQLHRAKADAINIISFFYL